MIVYLNGEFLNAAEAVLPVTEGGFLYGDGVYTTLRLYRGRPLDLEAHWQRLSAHARELELPAPPDRTSLAEIVARLAEDNNLTGTDARVRITLARGSPPPERILPLEDLDEISPTILVMTAPLPAELAAWQARGISVLCLGPAYSRGNLPHLKTLNILPSLLALRLAAGRGCAEALLTDRRGLLIEGAFSNLFLVDEGGLRTPAGQGFLAGRTRQRIMELAARLNLACLEDDLDRSALRAAREVFLCGSVREILPVVRIDGQPVGSGEPGAVTRRLQKEYRQAIYDALAVDPER